MKKILFLVVLFSFIFSFEKTFADEYKTENYQLSNIGQVEATYKIFPKTDPYNSGEFPGWVYDEQRKVIFFAPFNSKELYFLDPISLKVIHKHTFNDGIRNIKFLDDKLYIANGSQIDIINPTSKTVIKTYDLNNLVVDFVLYNGKILYITKTTSENSLLYEYKLMEKTEQAIPLTHYEVHASETRQIVLNPLRGIFFLYSSRGLVSFDANTYQVLQHIDNHNYLIQIDGDSIFYDQQEIDSSNIRNVKGTYGLNGHIKYVTPDYIFTHDSVYDRKTYLKKQQIVSTEYISPYYLMVGEQLYVYLPYDQIVIKTKLLHDDNESELKMSKSQSVMEFSSPISDYYFDRKTNLIYLLFIHSNELVVLNSVDMSLVKRMYVGSMPVKIKAYKEKLYVAFQGSSKLLELSPDLQSKQYLELGTRVSDFQFWDGSIFISTYPEKEMYRFNLDTKMGWLYSKYSFTRPLFTNENTNLVYHLRTDSTDLSLSIFKKEYPNFNYERQNLRFDLVLVNTENYLFKDNTFYFGQHKATLNDNKIEANNIKRLFNSVQKDYVINIDNGLIASNLALYDEGTGNQISSLPEEAEFFFFDNGNNGFLITKDRKGILKMSPPYNESPKMRKLPYLLNGKKVVGAPNLKDINRSFAKNEINYLIRLGVINGYPDGTFRPKQTITNVEAAAMLARVVDLYGTNVKMPYLVEVPRDNRFKNLLNDNLMEGKKPIFSRYTNNTTRLEMAKAIYVTFGLKGNNNIGFKDLSNSVYAGYLPAIESLAYHGITSGYTDGTFRPEKSITRDEFAAFLARTINGVF